MEPAISVQSFSGSFWVPQVAFKHAGALHTDLSRQRVTEQKPPIFKNDHKLGLAHLSLSILSIVLHFRNVYQLHHGAGQRSADMSWQRHIHMLFEDTINDMVGEYDTAQPVLQSPGMEKVHPAVHSVWP